MINKIYKEKAKFLALKYPATDEGQEQLFLYCNAKYGSSYRVLQLSAQCSDYDEEDLWYPGHCVAEIVIFPKRIFKLRGTSSDSL